MPVVEILLPHCCACVGSAQVSDFSALLRLRVIKKPSFRLIDFSSRSIRLLRVTRDYRGAFENIRDVLKMLVSECEEQVYSTG